MQHFMDWSKQALTQLIKITELKRDILENHLCTLIIILQIVPYVLHLEYVRLLIISEKVSMYYYLGMYGYFYLRKLHLCTVI